MKGIKRNYTFRLFGFLVFALHGIEDQGWFRIFGYGLSWKHISLPMIFSERHGYRKRITIGNWRIGFLKKMIDVSGMYKGGIKNPLPYEDKKFDWYEMDFTEPPIEVNNVVMVVPGFRDILGAEWFMLKNEPFIVREVYEEEIKVESHNDIPSIEDGRQARVIETFPKKAFRLYAQLHPEQSKSE